MLGIPPKPAVPPRDGICWAVAAVRRHGDAPGRFLLQGEAWLLGAAQR